MTKFQKLRKTVGFIVTAVYRMMLVNLYLLIIELPFVNKSSLAVKCMYHVVRVAQAMYSTSLLIGDDEFIQSSKEFLDQSISNWFSMV